MGVRIAFMKIRDTPPAAMAIPLNLNEFIALSLRVSAPSKEYMSYRGYFPISVSSLISFYAGPQRFGMSATGYRSLLHAPLIFTSFSNETSPLMVNE